MRNLLIAGGLIAAGGISYLMLQEKPAVVPAEPAALTELHYVPADTLIFSGQLTPFPLKQYLQATTFQQQALPDELLHELEHAQEPQQRFLASLLKIYFQAAQSPEQFQATYGLPDEMRMLFYTVGLLPVLRYQVSDEQAIWKMLDQAELESGFKHSPKQLKGLSYRSYSFVTKPGKPSLELLIGQRDGWLTVTLNTLANESADLEEAFALKQPARNLGDRLLLEDIRTRHGFEPSSISYFDHQQLVTGVTTQNKNRLATMLTRLVENAGGKNPLAELRTPACEQELGNIAAAWPRTAFGLYKVDINDQSVSMHTGMVVESSSQVVLGALNAIQGYLPSYLEEASVFGFGLGLDANSLNPSLAKLWNNMLTPEYKCVPLQQMQASVRAANPAALAMFTGMVQGVKGIGFSMLDYSLDMQGEMPQLTGFQGIATLSAENPDILFNMTKVFAPPLAQVELPADGSPVDLSYLLPPEAGNDVKPMLARKGEHLVLYTGEKGQVVAEAMAGEKVTSNGFMNLSMDYKQVLGPMLPMLEANPQLQQQPEVTEQLSMLKELDMKVKLDLRMNSQGIEFRTEMEMHKPEG